MRVITVRRHAEGTLERAGEMVRAQPRQFGEGGERDVVGDMLLDIGGHPLLPPRLTGSRSAAPPLMRMSSCVSAMPSASAYCLCIAPGFSTCDLSLRAVSQRLRS